MIGIGTLGSLGLNGGILYDAAASAFFARLTNQPTSARATLYNNLFVSLRQNGILPLLDALYITAAADSQAAGQNLVQNAYNLTAVNAPIFTADRGYAGDATSAALDTHLIPSVSNNYQLNSAHLSVYDRTSRASATQLQIGSSGGGFSYIGTLITQGTVMSVADANNAAADTQFAGTTSQGFFGGNRSGANSTAIYLNGVNKGNQTPVSGSTVPTSSFYLLARNSSGVNLPTSDQIASASIGGSLTDAQWSAYYNAIQAYMIGVGANV